MRETLYKLICVVSAFVVGVTSFALPVYADDEQWGSAYAYKLNDKMLECGTISTGSAGEFLPLDTENGEYPQGVIYGDLVQFDNGQERCLVIFSSDSYRGCVSAEVYGYDVNSDTAVPITVISKGYNVEDGVTREFALGYNSENRYIVIKEYRNRTKVSEEYYTVIDGTPFMCMQIPENVKTCGVLSYTRDGLYPIVDVSQYNSYLGQFFNGLKDTSAASVEYENILDNIAETEYDRLATVLRKTAGFGSFDIGNYSAMSDYSLAVKEHTEETQFNAITNVYDLGDEMYYVRYSTDRCFYNGTILRRSDAMADKYQILCVENDFIPFSDKALASLKETYSKNKLVLGKSLSSMELVEKPLFKINKLEFEKKFDVPQLLSPDVRKPAALIGGGICLAMLIFLWVYVSAEEEE